MGRWHDNWDVVATIFEFSKDVRGTFFTTNAIDLPAFEQAEERIPQFLLKALYLATFEVAKKWTVPIRN